jgi:hypothetical protein
MKKILALFLILCSQNLFSQPDTTNPAKKDSIYYKYSPFKLYYAFYVDRERIFQPNEKKEFAKIPEANKYYRKYKNQHLTYLLSLLSGIVVLSQGLDKSPNNKNTKKTIFITGGTGIIITSFIFNGSARKNMKKAIRIRNAAFGYSTK